MMNRFLSIALSLAISLAFIGTLQAFDIGGTLEKTTKETTKGVARSAVAKEYNKKLSKKDCSYPDATSLDPKCNVDDIITELNALRTSLESSGLAYDVDILINTFGPDWNIANQRAQTLRDQVRAQVGYWDYSVHYSKSRKNEVVFQVRIR